MKTRIFSLLMALLSFAWTAKADEITGLTLTISYNGGQDFTVPFVAQGWPDLDLTDEPATSILIKRIEAQTSGTVSNVQFNATMYKTENGLSPNDGWRNFDLIQNGKSWVLEFGEGVDLIDSEMGTSPRTFQFNVTAKDGSGNDLFYNNGGQDYKVLFVKSGGSSQTTGGIENLTLTIRLNGGEAFTQSFPSEDFSEIDLTDEQTTSLIIEKVEVEAEESVTDVSFSGTMYSTSQGGPSDEWQSFPLQNQGGGNWVLDMGEGVELVESKWLTEPKTKTFQFFVQAKDGEGNDIYYNNGGEDYKVTFSTGEGGDEDWKIKFVDEGAGQLVLRIGNEMSDYTFGGNGSRYPSEQPGQLSSLVIEQFGVLFQCNEGVSTKDVSLQYKVYEEGYEYEGGWNRVNALYYYYQDDNTMYCYADNLGIQVADGLQEGKNYVLEVNYQIVANGEYFFLGKGNENSKFRFSISSASQGGNINNLTMHIRHNGGESFAQTFPAGGWQELVLEGQTTSLVIEGAEATADESITNLAFYATIYDAADGYQQYDGDWVMVPFVYQGDGQWTINLSEAIELVEHEWQIKSKTKTFEFYVKGQNQEGNEVFFNNGGKNYKVTFSCGEGGGQTEGIRSFALTISCDGDVFTQTFPESGWENVVIPGQTSSIKILRAEVVTSESMTYAGFCSTIYDTSDGWQHDDGAWDWAPFDNQGGGRWVLDYGEGRELIDSEWLTESKTKTFEFFVGAGDSNGNEYQYANGNTGYGYNNNYKVTFTTGEGGGDDPDWKLKFYGENTASLNLIVNGEEQSYVFDGNATRLPDMQPGDAYSLVINGFYVSFITNDNVNAKDVSLQYKVYEEGQNGVWNRLNVQNFYREDVWNDEKQRLEHRTDCYAYDLGQNIAVGLEYGKDYVLEVMYQIVTSDGDYFFLGKDTEGSRFTFYYDTETGLKLAPAASSAEGVYNLAGQRVGDSYKGIVIRNGKKILK